MRRLLLFMFSVFLCLGYAQKIKNDSIDYSAFSFGIENQYLLCNIKQSGSFLPAEKPFDQLFFDLMKANELNPCSTLEINDTLIFMGWDFEKKLEVNPLLQKIQLK